MRTRSRPKWATRERLVRGKHQNPFPKDVYNTALFSRYPKKVISEAIRLGQQPHVAQVMNREDGMVWAFWTT